MKQTLTYSLMILAVMAVSFGFSSSTEDSKVHLKVTKEENGKKSVFEKVYDDMEALKADQELRAFDILVDEWVKDHKHSYIHEEGDGEKKIIINLIF